MLTTERDEVWKITGYEKRGTTLQADLAAHDVHENSWVEVPLYYYPGYHASLDGVEAELEQGTHGVVRVMIPDTFDEGRLVVWFEDFKVWKIADWISIFSLIGCICWFVICRGKYLKEK